MEYRGTRRQRLSMPLSSGPINEGRRIPFGPARRLLEPHMAPITAYVDSLRSPDRWLPYLAPLHGRVRARMLTILRDPGKRRRRAPAPSSAWIDTWAEAGKILLG